jgi:hypothetical protein
MLIEWPFEGGEMSRTCSMHEREDKFVTKPERKRSHGMQNVCTFRSQRHREGFTVAGAPRLSKCKDPYQ